MRSRRPSKGLAVAAACAGAVLLGCILPGPAAVASESRLTSFASMLSDRGLEGTDPESAERLPEEKPTARSSADQQTAGRTAAGGSAAGSVSAESETAKPSAGPESDTEIVADEKPAAGSRLEGFASLLSDRGLEGGKPEDAERLPEEADERLTGFAELADQVGGTRTVSGRTSDKRLLGFASQVASSDAAFGDRKEDKVIVMNAPAGALEISSPVDSRKENASDAALRNQTALLLEEIKGMSDQEILERLLAEAAEREGEEYSTEEQVVLGATKVVKDGGIPDGASWLATRSGSARWTEETWSELFPADHREDGRKLIDIGDYKLTAYCPCEICTGKTDGITKSGTRAVQGRTIAVDPKLLTLGMQVVIDGHVFTAEDTGSAIKGSHIDIFMDSHEQALAFGTRKAEVYLLWEPRGTAETAAGQTAAGRKTATTGTAGSNSRNR